MPSQCQEQSTRNISTAISRSIIRRETADFSLKYYRTVRINSGKQVPEGDARQTISDWVASCISESSPIVEYESPKLSPTDELDSSGIGESTQDSFNSFSSQDDEFNLSAHDLAGFRGWAPGDNRD